MYPNIIDIFISVLSIATFSKSLQHIRLHEDGAACKNFLSVSSEAMLRDLATQAVSSEAMLPDLSTQAVSSKAMLPDLAKQAVSSEAMLPDLAAQARVARCYLTNKAKATNKKAQKSQMVKFITKPRKY